MVRRIVWALLSSTVFAGFGATAAISADSFEDFPDLPTIERIDTAFREAGVYAGVRGGAGLANDTAFTIAGPSQVANSYDTGLTASFFVGYEISDLYRGAGVRLEGEVGLARYDVDTHAVGGTGFAAADSFGKTTAVSAMVNLYVDYGLGALRPFLGGGIGVARVSFDHHGVTGNPGVMDDTENGLAWQVMGGLGYEVTPALTLEAMLRYQSIHGVELIAASGPATEVDLGATQMLLGARMRF